MDNINKEELFAYWNEDGEPMVSDSSVRLVLSDKAFNPYDYFYEFTLNKFGADGTQKQHYTRNELKKALHLIDEVLDLIFLDAAHIDVEDVRLRKEAEERHKQYVIEERQMQIDDLIAKRLEHLNRKKKLNQQTND